MVTRDLTAAGAAEKLRVAVLATRLKIEEAAGEPEAAELARGPEAGREMSNVFEEEGSTD